METKISINLEEETFDLEIRGAWLDHIVNLPTTVQAVADNLKAGLVLHGVKPEVADAATNLLLDGKRSSQDILRLCREGGGSPCTQTTENRAP